MAKASQIVGVVLFLGVGAVAAFVVANPTAARELLGTNDKGKAQAAAPGAAPAKKSTEVTSADGAKDSAAQKASAEAPKNSAAAKKSDAPAEETFDRKAAAKPAASGEGTAAKDRRPPKRDEAAATPAAGIVVTRKGRSLGPKDAIPDVAAPIPELYPFDVIGRSFPDANTVKLDLAIRNSSGTQWKTAYVLFRSARHPVAQQFEINDWQIDEVVGLEYVFPRGELDARVDKLRVLAVVGEERESALAALLSRDRHQLVQVRANTRGQGQRLREGDQLNAPGLLSFVGQLQQPSTGIQVTTAAKTDPRTVVLSVAIPEEMKLPELALEIRETSEERLQAVRATKEFHGKAVEIEDALNGLAKTISSAPYLELSETKIPAALTEIQGKLGDFNRLGTDLARKLAMAKDPEIKKMAPMVGTTSLAVVGQIEELERQVRVSDQFFTIRK